MMTPGLSITVVDPDDDYLGIEIHAQSQRFAATTFIYAGFSDLTQFADQIAGFPAGPRDERRWEFGHRDPGFAGGFCGLRFHCLNRAGHAALAVSIVDKDRRHDAANADFTFQVEAADIDRFVAQLRVVERDRAGAAVLQGAGWDEGLPETDAQVR
jgi:hypothetical protein